MHSYSQTRAFLRYAIRIQFESVYHKADVSGLDLGRSSCMGTRINGLRQLSEHLKRVSDTRSKTQQAHLESLLFLRGTLETDSGTEC